MQHPRLPNLYLLTAPMAIYEMHPGSWKRHPEEGDASFYSYRELAEAASQTAHRATRSEIRILSAVDVKAIQADVDAMAKELRLLDNKLQQTNWTTDL